MDEAARERGQRMLFDVFDALRAAQSGRPIPGYVEKRWREEMRATARAEALRRLRSELDLPA
ncbi:hypothetical protein [Streptomyces sp. NPDC002994]|uniref:hypothetical protein n=1 Tax=Streptomyces sp. NPDC002994 TaxID=3154441 RepID=UPI0033BCA7DE